MPVMYYIFMTLCQQVVVVLARSCIWTKNMTWEIFPAFMSLWECVSVFVGQHIAQGTNFSDSRIPRVNEVRQESAELVNSWRTCQMGRQQREHTQTHKASGPYHNA